MAPLFLLLQVITVLAHFVGSAQQNGSRYRPSTCSGKELPAPGVVASIPPVLPPIPVRCVRNIEVNLTVGMIAQGIQAASVDTVSAGLFALMERPDLPISPALQQLLENATTAVLHSRLRAGGFPENALEDLHARRDLRVHDLIDQWYVITVHHASLMAQNTLNDIARRIVLEFGFHRKSAADPLIQTPVVWQQLEALRESVQSGRTRGLTFSAVGAFIKDTLPGIL
jgi:hypothetical protein